MNFKSNETVGSQIIEYVKKKIFSGAYACGARLPAIRDLAQICRVNPNTIVKVYAELSAEGLIYTDSTNGKFVSTDAAFVRRLREDYLRQKTAAFVREMREAGGREQDVTELVGEAFRGGKEEERDGK